MSAAADRHRPAAEQDLLPGAGAAHDGALAGLRVGIAAISLSRGGAERAAAHWAAVAHEQGAGVGFFAVEASEEPYAPPAGVAVSTAGKTAARDTARVALALHRFSAGHDVMAAFQPYVGLLCVLAPWGAWRHIPNVVTEEARVGAGRREGVLFVGRFVPEKRPLLALRAAAAARLPITFIGDGPLRATLVEEAGRLGVGHALRLVPFTRDLWPLYAQHRVLVLTSRYETFANVIVESLAAGTPVVSVDGEFGPREILSGARYSALVGETVEAVGAGISAVGRRPGVAAEAEECLAVATRYRRDAVAPTIAELLRQVALGPGKTGRT